MPKFVTTEKGEKGIAIDPRKRVEVIATDAHPAMQHGGSKIRKRMVAEHTIPTLVAKGYIEDPNAKPKKTVKE